MRSILVENVCVNLALHKRPNYVNSFVSSKTIFGATSSYYDVLHLTWTTKKRQLQIEMIDQLCNKWHCGSNWLHREQCPLTGD
uniref:Uncharacterized protein n=1 Tax=Helianthus annuus TaxID=4232 RepID=A0A251T416_HELAN